MASAGKLRVVSGHTLPLGEVSGICVRSAGSGAELVAISDSSHVLARGALEGSGPSGKFSTFDLQASLGVPRKQSQWEGVVADAA